MSSSSTLSTNSLDAKRLGLPDVAFVGKAGSGKTTGAELLVQLGYHLLSFARPVKSIAASIWGEAARTDREKLQRLGMAVRDIDSNAWINLLMADVVRTPKPQVVDDLRFPNEWFALKAEGFVIVRVQVEEITRTDRLKASGKWQDESQLHHLSERAVDHLAADYKVSNGDKDDFYDDIINIIIKERRRR